MGTIPSLFSPQRTGPSRGKEHICLCARVCLVLASPSALPGRLAEPLPKEASWGLWPEKPPWAGPRTPSLSPSTPSLLCDSHSPRGSMLSPVESGASKEAGEAAPPPSCPTQDCHTQGTAPNRRWCLRSGEKSCPGALRSCSPRPPLNKAEQENRGKRLGDPWDT